MKIGRFVFWIVLSGLIFVVAAGCQPGFQPESYTDDAGRMVNIAESPQRIISHVPSITEIIFAIGLEERVVGVSEYCDYPEEAKRTEKVGSFSKPSVEKIVDLEPDLVLTNGGDEQLMAQFDSLGITYLVIDPEDIDSILRDIELLGKVTGVEKQAGELVADMRGRMSRVADKVKGAPSVRVFYTFAVTDLNNPWTAGPGSFIDSLIAMSGAENIAAVVQSPYAKLSIEEIVSSDPEVIILGIRHGYLPETTVEQLREHPVWRQITAVKHGRVYTVDGDLLNRPGPRIVQGLEEIARFIHPELFE
ncbi:MAG: cobalamin-binding protein [Dehalococcoidales bacterium]|nr:cobalamin-binding protein [Dehalococcoidales bacterium]